MSLTLFSATNASVMAGQGRNGKSELAGHQIEAERQWAFPGSRTRDHSGDICDRSI